GRPCGACAARRAVRPGLSAVAGGPAAGALAVIFGVEHYPAAALIFVSAAAGAILRRGLAQWSTNVFIQPFCAALLAGIIGGVAGPFHFSLTLRLFPGFPRLGPVPGPPLLNTAPGPFNGP